MRVLSSDSEREEITENIQERLLMSRKRIISQREAQLCQVWQSVGLGLACYLLNQASQMAQTTAQQKRSSVNHPDYLQAPTEASVRCGQNATQQAQPTELHLKVPVSAVANAPEFLKQAIMATQAAAAGSGGTHQALQSASCQTTGGTLTTLQTQDGAQIISVPASYEGPTKVIPVQATVETRPMTDAERLKADKEQLKINLQNFRKSRKTAKEVQVAKQAAALKAQKTTQQAPSQGGTYQAFDLQNYKSPEDCLIGLQSAKKMLQQSALFQGTTAAPAAPAAPNTFAQTSQAVGPQMFTRPPMRPSDTPFTAIYAPQATNQPRLVGGPSSGGTKSYGLHHPPPPSTRRNKRQHLQAIVPSGQGRGVPQDHQKENNSNQSTSYPTTTPNTKPTKRQSRFVVPPPASGSPPKNTYQSTSPYHQAQSTISRSSPEADLPVGGVSPLTSLSQQLDKLTACLDYDQAQICQLFQQKYQEMVLSQSRQASKSKNTSGQGLNAGVQSTSGQGAEQAVEPNLSLLLHMVQQELAKKQQLKQQSQQESEAKVQNEGQEVLPSSTPLGADSHEADLQGTDCLDADCQDAAHEDAAHEEADQEDTFSDCLSTCSTLAQITHEDEAEIRDQAATVQQVIALHQNSVDSFDQPESTLSDGSDGQEPESQQRDESESEEYPDHTCYYGADDTEAYEEQVPVEYQAPTEEGEEQTNFAMSDYVEAVESYSPEPAPDRAGELEAIDLYDGHEESSIEGDHQHCDQAQVCGEHQAIAKPLKNKAAAQQATQQADSELSFSLDELYAQAHRHLSKTDNPTDSNELRMWQQLYPRLMAGGLTPQNLQEIVSMGNLGKLTSQQASEQLYQNLYMAQKQALGNTSDGQGEVYTDAGEEAEQFEWCSDEESEGEQVEEAGEEVGEEGTQDSQQHNLADCSEDGSDSQSYREQLNLIHSILQPPTYLSQSFKRFFAEFESNIDFILQWEYEILPQQRQGRPVCKSEQKRLKNKLENLLGASRDMCRRFTGPHSVLQIFLEKIVASVNYIGESLKERTLKALCLWTEEQVPLLNDQSASQADRPSAVLAQKRANPELLIATKTTSKPAFKVELKPKPLLSCLDNYVAFLEELRLQYQHIMNTCAPQISKHFTKLTSVIVENTQYEFPSTEIHKAVISKLILNDQKFFRTLVQHIQSEFKANEGYIRGHCPQFVSTMDLFLQEVDDDMKSNQTKIDIYMRDLRKHALDEYEDLYREEQDLMIKGQGVQESGGNQASGTAANKKKRKKKKNRKSQEQNPEEASQAPDQALDFSFSHDPQPPSSSQTAAQDPNSQTAAGKRKKRNRRNKKKGNGDQASVTNELLNNLDTDDLVDFINNGGSSTKPKADDLKKYPASNTDQPESQASPGKAISRARAQAKRLSTNSQKNPTAQTASTGQAISASSTGQAGQTGQEIVNQESPEGGLPDGDSQEGPVLVDFEVQVDGDTSFDSAQAFEQSLNLYKSNQLGINICQRARMLPNVSNEWVTTLAEELARQDQQRLKAQKSQSPSRE